MTRHGKWFISPAASISKHSTSFSFARVFRILASFINWSADGGKTWQPVVKDWEIIRHPPDPGDFWSQSISWGNVELKNITGPVRVRFRNTGGKNYRRAEAHLVYEIAGPGTTDVTFAWTEGGGARKTASHTFANTAGKEDDSWEIATAKDVQTLWVEYKGK